MVLSPEYLLLSYLSYLTLSKETCNAFHKTRGQRGATAMVYGHFLQTREVSKPLWPDGSNSIRAPQWAER